MPTLSIKCSLTHHNLGVPRQIVMEGVGLVDRGKPGPNDRLFDDPSAHHIFINISGLTREAAIAFDATKKYDVVITEAVLEPVRTPEPPDRFMPEGPLTD